MEYRIIDTQTGATLDVLTLHVFARTYHAAWRLVHGTAPRGRHNISALNLLIVFEPSFKASTAD